MRALEVGPDYEGLPMLRRLLAGPKAAIVHSGWVERELRAAGFQGRWRKFRTAPGFPKPAAWIIASRLGLDESHAASSESSGF